jgi:hypothetical protein
MIACRAEPQLHFASGAEEIRVGAGHAQKPCLTGVIRAAARNFTQRFIASFTTPLGPFLKPAGLSWRTMSWEF